MRVELELNDRVKPELVRTIVEYESGGRNEVVGAVRGLDEGAYPAGYRSFGWTQGVRALTVLLLRWAAWGRYSQRGIQVSQPCVKGRRPSLAASLNDVVTKRPRWFMDIFASDPRGHLREEFIKRSNPDFKTMPDMPVEITIDPTVLLPPAIRVNVGPDAVETPEEIDELADRIEQAFADRTRARSGSHRRSTATGREVSGKRLSVGKRAPMPVKGNPPLPPELLVGRKEDLRNIKTWLGVRGQTHKRHAQLHELIVIRGWPGVGKSTLVAALANDPEVARAFPDGVLWTSLGSAPSLIAELANWGKVLGNESVTKSYDVHMACEQLRIALRNKRMLLLVDDVWEAEHALAYRVGGPACRIIVSTRLPSLAHALALCPQDIYILAPLEEEAALELFEHLVPTAMRKHRDACAELVRQLEGLPLAIRVAAGLLNAEASYRWGIEDLILELRGNAGRVLESDAPGDMFDHTRTNLPKVAALLARSTDRLDAHTRTCFAMLGAFAPKPATFDLEAMAAVWDVGDPKVVVRSLVSRGLLEPVGEARFQMHSLLVQHARALCSE